MRARSGFRVPLLRQAITLNMIGNCYREMGDYQKGIENSSAALEIARSLSDRVTEAEILSILGRCYRDQDRLEDARASFEQALQNYRASRSRIGEAVQLRNLSSLAIARGDYRDAARLADRAVIIAREVGDKRNEALILNYRMQASSNLGQKRLAILFGKGAV